MSSSKEARLHSRNPATGELLGSVDVTPSEAISGVVAAARAAQPGWHALGHDGRAAALAQGGQELERRAEDLASLITREMGKPLAEARIEVGSLWKGFDQFLDEVGDAVAPDTVEDGRARSTVYHDPLGVCAAITPWNFPMSMPHWMILPALAAGNTVVFKPSEETPLCGQAFAEALGAGLPESVLQVIHGADDQGKTLVASDVDLIAFTGSRETGKYILKAASASLKRVILELGGKDPLIVLESADLNRAAEFAAWNSFRNAGQVCISTERIFVVDSVAAEFEHLLTEATRLLQLGNGLDEGVTVGPMVNERQRQLVVEQVQAAVAEGASILTGGETGERSYMTPTVLAGVTDNMAIARDETFGPVASVTRVASADDAVRRANDTPFGLGAVVFGADDEATNGVARRLQAGMIGINRPAGGAKGTPWVGARESGYGFHKSKDGHRQFTQTRVVTKALE